MSRIALITGASGGLGSHMAKRMAEEGYQLALHYYQNPEPAIKLLESLPAHNGQHHLLKADLTQEDEIIALVDQLKGKLGHLDVLINNAGIPFSGLSWKQTVKQWQDVFAINTMAPWLLSKYCIPLLRETKKGRIVYLSSIVAHRPLTGTSIYAASKAALEGLTRAQAIELSRFGITVNCIAPGYFDAGMISSVEEEIRKQIILNTPEGRLGQADELAEAVLYLCSEKASFTTGQVLHINGGLYI